MGGVGAGEHHEAGGAADGLIGGEHVYIAGKNQIDLIEIVLMKIAYGGMIALPGFHIHIRPGGAVSVIVEGVFNLGFLLSYVEGMVS